MRHRQDSSLLDLDVLDAVSALIRAYEAVEQQRQPPRVPLGDRAQRVSDALRSICEWRLGRPGGTATPGLGPSPEHLNTTSEIIACLKRIRKSITRWTKVGGRQGYLSFVEQYIR